MPLEVAYGQYSHNPLIVEGPVPRTVVRVADSSRKVRKVAIDQSGWGEDARMLIVSYMPGWCGPYGMDGLHSVAFDYEKPNAAKLAVNDIKNSFACNCDSCVRYFVQNGLTQHLINR